jgi:RND family efflux transporter MFP subunit
VTKLGSPPGKLSLDKPGKGKVPTWYRRSRTFWAGGTIVALLAIGGGLRYKFADADRAEEITAMVKRANLSITVTERGELESSKTIDARCEVEGYQNKIVSILPEGTKVKGPGWFWWEPGQVVVTFDKEKLKTDYLTRDISYKTAVGKEKAAKGELEVQRNKAQGEEADAKLALDLAVLDRDKYLQGEYQQDVDEKKGDIEVSKKELKEAEENLEKYRKFVKKGFGTPEQLRINEIQVEGRRFALRSKEAKLMVLEKFQRKRQETELTAKAAEAVRKLDRAKKAGAAAIDKAQSDLEAAQAAARVEKQALDRIYEQLDKCVVRAPADGVLVYDKSRWYDPSSQVRAGGMVHNQQTLFQLPDLARMQVKVKIHESMIKKVKKGQKAEISVESEAHMVLHGTVEKVGILADSMGYWNEGGVKEYLTIIKIDDLPENAGLNPGFTAQVKILANELPDVLLVPVQAVAEKEGKHFAYTCKFGGVDRREVDVGDTNEKFVEIKSGLDEGEKVALDARSRLTAETKASEKKSQPDEPKTGEKKKEEKKEEPKPTQPTPAPAQAAPVAAAPAKG